MLSVFNIILICGKYLIYQGHASANRLQNKIKSHVNKP